MSNRGYTVSLWLDIQLTWHGTICGRNVQSLTLCSGNLRVILEFEHSFVIPLNLNMNV